jgi:hypothetical protein
MMTVICSPSEVKKNFSPSQRVRGIMRRFAEACSVELDTCHLNSPEQGKLYLTYMFGAVDTLCQVYHLGPLFSASLFQSLLEESIGGYSPAKARQLTQDVLRASATREGQIIMGEGGESVQTWMAGTLSAPYRLHKLLHDMG